MPHPTVTPLADGQTLAAEAGPVTVAVQCVRLGHAYRLSIRHASTGAEVDELSRSYPAERTARHAARVATTLFRSGLSVLQVVEMTALFAAPQPGGGRR